MQSNPSFNSSFFTNPFAAFAQLHQNAPVFKFQASEGQEAWLVTRFENVVTVLKSA